MSRLCDDGWRHRSGSAIRPPLTGQDRGSRCTARYSGAVALAAMLRRASRHAARESAQNAWEHDHVPPTACRLRAFAPLMAALIVISATVRSSTAHAAVNYCMPLMQAEPAEGSSVTIAKRVALANWLRRAATFGVAYTRWGLSWNHELVCRATGRGTVVCQAAGHPCAVHQVPPDSFIPLRPGVLQTAINPAGLARVGAR
jgi:hypothetical protein